jgi:hypothetical protein
MASQSQILGLLHEVRRDQDGHPLGRQAGDPSPKLAARQRIDSGRGLIEEQDFGLVHQGTGRRQALLIVKREIAARDTGHRGEVTAPAEEQRDEAVLETGFDRGDACPWRNGQQVIERGRGFHGVEL